MTLSRRNFLTDASALGLLTTLLPEISKAQKASMPVPTEELPHDSYDFWNGFFDSVNPMSPNYGDKKATRGPEDQLPDPHARTQYLHYSAEKKRLRYASDIEKEELLDHDGDVAVSIMLSQFRPGEGEADQRPSQLRVDTTQIHPFMNIVAPLAWTAIASITPNKAGKVSLDELGFKSAQSTQGSGKILLTQGTGKMAVNISKAASTSFFVKALNVMLKGMKTIAPIVTFPAVSVPALSAFSEALSYWEDRTRFIMSGNLTTAVATQQAMNDPDREARYIGLASGDYLMVPQRHVEELAKALPNLDLIQGYLIAKDSDPNLPPAERAQRSVPGITYVTMRVSVLPIHGATSKANKSDDDSSDDDSSDDSEKKHGAQKSSAKSATKSSTAKSSSTAGHTHN